MRLLSIILFCILISACGSPINQAAADTYVDITPATDLQTAINNCASPSVSNVYWIRMAAGTYNVMNLQTRDYVHLMKSASAGLPKDVYDGTFVWIKGERANGSINDGNYQTIKLTTTTTLEGIKITCKNMRYPIHDDGIKAGAAITIDNCWVEHLGNWVADGSRYATFAECGWNSCHAHGCGTNSGVTITITGNTIIGRQYGGALYAHNNTGFTSASHIIATNNIIKQADGGPAIFMVSLGSQQVDTLQLTNNVLTGAIMVEDIPWLGISTANHSEWVITGSGNTYPYFFNDISYAGDVTGKNYRYTGEHTHQYTNTGGSVICQGCAACFTDGTKATIRLMTSTDSSAIFAGVAMTSITANASGSISVQGQWMEADLYKTSDTLAVGDTLAIDPTTPGRFKKGTINPIIAYNSDWTWYQGYLGFLAANSITGLSSPSAKLFAALPIVSPNNYINISTGQGPKSLASQASTTGVDINTANSVQNLVAQDATDDASGAVRVKPGKSLAVQ